MTWDRLVCAHCAGPVSEGRCATCRAHRARLQQEAGPFAHLSPATLLALLAAVVAVLAVAQRVATA